MAVTEPIVAREVSYTDIDFGFRANPITGDIALKRDDEAVKQSVLNILLTNRGERPFDPDFGANIRNQLFENFDPIVKQLIEDDVRTALRNYEPRVRVLNVRVGAKPDQNSIDISVEFEIQSPEQTVTTVNFSVERLR
jgi:phage baseplate assembly protein W